MPRKVVQNDNDLLNLLYKERDRLSGELEGGFFGLERQRGKGSNGYIEEDESDESEYYGSSADSMEYEEPEKKTVTFAKPKAKGGGKKGVTPPHLAKWLNHLAMVRSKNKNLDNKQIFALAKQTYRK